MQRIWKKKNIQRIWVRKVKITEALNEDLYSVDIESYNQYLLNIKKSKAKIWHKAIYIRFNLSIGPTIWKCKILKCLI